MHIDTELVGVVVVLCDVGAHLAPVVREEDALCGLEAHAGHAAEAGPDQLRVTVLAGALPPVEPHRVARVRGQVDAVVVLREGRRRLHGLDHAGVIKSVVAQRRHARPYDGSLRQPLAGRHRIHSSTKRCLQNSSTLTSSLKNFKTPGERASRGNRHRISGNYENFDAVQHAVRGPAPQKAGAGRGSRVET